MPAMPAMRSRLVTVGFIAFLTMADLAGAVWLWVLWHERVHAPARSGAEPSGLGAGQAEADKPVAALALDQSRSARPVTPAQAPPAELNLACMLAVQAQMSASRQRSACP